MSTKAKTTKPRKMVLASDEIAQCIKYFENYYRTGDWLSDMPDFIYRLERVQIALEMGKRNLPRLK